MFGGIPLKNAQIGMGGIGKHDAQGWLTRCREKGVDFINIGPDRGDADPGLEAEWIAPRPNTDTALMLGLAHTLVMEGLHNLAIRRHNIDVAHLALLLVAPAVPHSHALRVRIVGWYPLVAAICRVGEV